MRFTPHYCPYDCCPSRTGSTAFRCHRRGTYLRACDGRRVPRFHCQGCGRTFSSQTYRVDFRWRLPRLHIDLARMLVSKVTRRQAARILEVNRKPVDRRFQRLASIALRLHRARLEQLRANPILYGAFQFDELETYEASRLDCPLTCGVAIHRGSLFVVDAGIGTLPPRLRKASKLRRAMPAKRRSQSKQVVRRIVEAIASVSSRSTPAWVESDMKSSYPVELRRAFRGRRFEHRVTHSKVARTRENPLFPINHTFAMMRDCLAPLVRRTWASSKSRGGLRRAVWIWIAYRNYIRAVTNKANVTPWQILRPSAKRDTIVSAFRRRWPDLDAHYAH